MEPIPLVSISTKRMVTPESVKATRIGVGAFVDHAAGRPLHRRPPTSPMVTQPIPPQARLSFPPPPPPMTRAWGHHQQNLGYQRSLGYHRNDYPNGYPRTPWEPFAGNDAPVDLPLRSRVTTYAVLVALVLGFIGVLVSVAAAGSSHSQHRTGAPTAVQQTRPGPK